MAQIHAGLASHGMGFFANGQTSGKGQRHKSWHSQPGENILMSVIIQPPAAFARLPFLFNACVSLSCKQFIESIISENVNIKWPNDLFVRDRKAGGILIENSFRGKSWNWAVIGIGINVNQIGFPEMNRTPISFKQITGKSHDPEKLARLLRKHIVDFFDSIKELDTNQIMQSYNEALYLSGKTVKMKHNDEFFDTSIVKVSSEGQLITRDEVERKFNFGEVEWVAGA